MAAGLTFLFTDIERSTRRWEEDPESMSRALADHDEAIYAAIAERGGTVFSTAGDGIGAAFRAPTDAVAVALVAARAGGLPVRVAIHVGAAEHRDGGFFGTTLNRAARVRDLAHGGQILCSRAAADLIAGSLPEGQALIDHGEHRLRDLAMPEHVFELRAAPDSPWFPALRSESTRAALPAATTALVGRDDDVGFVAKLLHEHRLVVLTGVGGVGKTRLAIEIAETVADRFTGGVTFVDLAPVSEASLVPRAVAAALGMVGVAAGDASVPTEDMLRAYLSSRPSLLVLDNCEHVVAACAGLVHHLLAGAPTTRVLATSRESFGMEGEQAWPVPSLETEAGVELFAHRAQAVRPGFALSLDNQSAVTEIVQRLDGIPLAIELAAAQMAHLSPAQVADRLDNRFRLLAGARRRVPRQQTLEAAMNWSHDLLDDEDRAVFRRLSVFASGFTLEAAESVTGSADVLARLASLVAKSLVVAADDGRGGTRYRMLETVRLYAAERLVAAGEADELRGGHRDWFVSWVESFPPEVAALSNSAGDQFEVEHGNLRAAVEWSHAEGRADLVARMAGRLGALWRNQGHYEEALGWNTLGLTAPDLPADVVVSCRNEAAMAALILVDPTVMEHAVAATETPGAPPSGALLGAWALRGFLEAVTGAAMRIPALVEQALTSFERSEDLLDAVGPGIWTAALRGVRGFSAMMSPDIGDPVEQLEQSLAAIPDEREYWYHAMLVRTSLAVAYHLAGRDAEAAAVSEPTLEEIAGRPVPKGSLVAVTLPFLGLGLVGAGRYAEGSEASLAGLEHALRSGVPLAVGDCFLAIGSAAALRDDPVAAARLLAAGVKQGEGKGPIPFRSPWGWAVWRRYRPASRDALGRDHFDRETELGASLPLDDAVKLARGVLA